MKKTILAIATIIALTAGNGFAQRYKGHTIPAPAVANSRGDNAYEELKINQLDRIVGLTRKQENKIKKIENQYDRLKFSDRRFGTIQGAQRLEQQKEREILSVLTPQQRERWFTYQNNGKYNKKWRG